MFNRRRQVLRYLYPLLLFAIAWLLAARPALATDYFLTLGGGYAREENQASLEANVLFFKQLLKDKHPEPLKHDIFFAHGDDSAADLQVIAAKPNYTEKPKDAEKGKESESPVTDLLSSLYRRQPNQQQQQVTYRKHNVTQIIGALDPQLIHDDLEKLAKTATSHDRLIVYVTAHGAPGAKDDPFNTSIDCWDSKKITAREFSHWLDKLPPDMPVVMVMAQCFCGGFGRLIFQDLDESKGFSPQARVGFFAQQHDLPAAGCRPDIEHDEEFSSYFWGAIAGHRRGGAKVDGCDIDGDGVVSFAEAYAYAVTAADTIDIPLRTSEVFLRKYSRLKNSEAKPDADVDSKSAKDDSDHSPPELAPMDGSLQSFVDRGDPISGRIVTQLAKRLDFKLDDDASDVRSEYRDQRRGGPGRGGRGGRGGPARRDLLKEIADKWPELGDERHWQESSLLKADNQKDLLAEIKDLPSWKAYDDRLKQMATSRKESQQRELRGVLFRRLIGALETINLAKNLPLVAKSEVVERYRQIVALEGTSLTPSPSGNATRQPASLADDAPLAAATAAIKARPSAEAYQRRAMIESRLDRHAEALADLDAAIQLAPSDSGAYSSRGDENFFLARFQQSLADYDKEISLAPDSGPGHWRRGIACYYSGKYDDGAKQFAAYHTKVDDNDVENSIWRCMCMARGSGLEKARADMLVVKHDGRVAMMEAYRMFAGKLEPADVLKAAEAEAPATEGNAAAQLNAQRFYAHLYVGLYYDMIGKKELALTHLRQAEQHRIDHFMWQVARVHAGLLDTKR